MKAGKNTPLKNIRQVKRILVALDYDPSSKKVAETGFELAESMDAKVTLLHVVSDIVYYSSLEYSPITGFSDFSNTTFTELVDSDGLVKAAYYFLDKHKHGFRKEDTQTLVEKGDTADVIIRTAEILPADIVIMGSHSRRWLDKILVGSVTEKVLRNISIPLFIVPIKEQKNS